MKTDKTPERAERREAPKTRDPVLKLLIVLSILGWSVFVLALVLFHYARPELITGLITYWKLQVREHWLESYSVYLIITVVLTFIISAAGTVIRRKRIRRRGDAIWLNLPVLLVISVMFILYLFKHMD
ncbi:hypothetical protein HMF8227_01329 [Saliniradius amylolyticus]|uniref:Uncharacterized protein n=1 Tax=Saliniradius amylolyticus TaxID=2183582 RepID=A0A2S2E470_9ALTE|nr:hypothetical protein [Saliniradius amylolyticus]AWL11807.1 hypothetical protein HMF8227_01329 [Saliniradius amylolyticus]